MVGRWGVLSDAERGRGWRARDLTREPRAPPPTKRKALALPPGEGGAIAGETLYVNSSPSRTPGNHRVVHQALIDGGAFGRVVVSMLDTTKGASLRGGRPPPPPRLPESGRRLGVHRRRRAQKLKEFYGKATA